MQDGQPVRDERMAQSVFLPHETLAEPRRRDLRTLMQANRPRSLFARRKPELEVIRDRNQSALPSLGLVGVNGDEAAIQIDFLPIEPLQFGGPMAGEGSQGQDGRSVLSAFVNREAILSGVKMETEVFVSLYLTMAGKGLPPLIR